MKTMLVTGSGGLVGSVISEYFLERGWQVHGVDNNTRKLLFGDGGDVKPLIDKLTNNTNYRHWYLDISYHGQLGKIFEGKPFDAIVHAAAQPSHDWAATNPLKDFAINATGTGYLLEYARIHSPETPLIHFSTSKVYGDNPNQLMLQEGEKRYELIDPNYRNGISETLSIDHCLHSLFGVSKTSGDLLAQEYGRYFNMPTCILRPGCITGANHAGVKLHGFLNYLVKCVMEGRYYHILGHKGKQVRDNIHPIDFARFIEMFIDKPRCGVVYNMGGGYENSCSILEALETVQLISGKQANFRYTNTPRIGDHVVYYSDLAKVKKDYPDWNISMGLDPMIVEMIKAFKAGL